MCDFRSVIKKETATVATTAPVLYMCKRAGNKLAKPFARVTASARENVCVCTSVIVIIIMWKKGGLGGLWNGGRLLLVVLLYS